jgi:tetratricopeptide (TPR) repeat protein
MEEIAMKHAALLFLGVLSCCVLADHPPGKQDAPAVVLEGLSNLSHPVSTKNREAQKFFDQGLRLIYAFNHDEALRAFRKAAEIDPGLAMAYWGMAVAVGPNYNVDAMEAQLKDAYASIQKAQELAKAAPRYEQDYVAALAKCYAADPKTADKKKLALAYKEAMGELAKRYPDDLDAATLYAESAMNLRPWDLWTLDGKPAEGTVDILQVLERVLRRNPNHIGACHYYIHAIEASPYPERALGPASRLAELAPAAGHLVHMPSHIYIRLGDFAAAARANEKAAAADRAYIEKWKVEGIYPMMYYSHNLHFLAVAHAMQGRYGDAKKAADDLALHVAPHAKDMPMLEAFLPTPTLIQARFHRWDDILASPAPDEKLTITRSLRHFARGLALAARNKVEDAEAELIDLKKLHAAMPEDLPYGSRNSAKKVLEIPSAVLQAQIAAARNEVKSAVLHFQKAIEVEDGLNYIEPADWHLPVREALGALYLRAGKAAEAEKVFRADLENNRRNPRSLFGLMESLKAQGNTAAAQFVEQVFREAWRNAEKRELQVSDL